MLIMKPCTMTEFLQPLEYSWGVYSLSFALIAHIILITLWIPRVVLPGILLITFFYFSEVYFGVALALIIMCYFYQLVDNHETSKT